MKIKKIIREFIDNNQSGLNWLNDVDPNIFSQYKLIILDRLPTELEYSKILSDARKYPISNISDWETNVDDLKRSRYNNNNTSYVRIDEDNDLLLGAHFQQVIDNYQEKEVINISDLFSGNLKESKEPTGLEWIEDVIPTIPAKDLKPKDRFQIVAIEGRSFKEYMKDSDLEKLDPYKTIFIMDEEHGFLTERGGQVTEYNDDVRDIWLQEDGDTHGGWVLVDEIIVTLLPNKKRT
jgi:hypothetical protein